MIVHAGLIACRALGVWRGALITGASGSGKSDLMLRLLDQGFRLAADDRTLLWSSEGRLFGRAPDTITGLIEARGLCIEREGVVPFAEVLIVAECAPAAEEIERLPDPATEAVMGVDLPKLRLHALEPSAPAKLRRALQRLGAARFEA